MTEEITGTEDVLDTRTIMERISYLEIDEDSLDEDEQQELADLRQTEEDYSGSEGWNDGAGLIRESYFREYAEELADDIGAIDRNARWPLDCIDWDKAADELKQDYTPLDVRGTEYWTRQ